MERGILKALCSVLTLKDARILAVALEGIENILKEGDKNGMDVRFLVKFNRMGRTSIR